jgi:hypothetical protein
MKGKFFGGVERKINCVQSQSDGMYVFRFLFFKLLQVEPVCVVLRYHKVLHKCRSLEPGVEVQVRFFGETEDVLTST